MALFDELLLKMAQGEKLSPAELEELRNTARAVEETKNAVKSWLTPGSSDPRFRAFTAESSIFTEPPVSGVFLEFFGDTAIPDNTDTAVTFQDTYGKPVSYRIEGDKIYTLVPGKFYLFSGVVQWEGNGTGRREVLINAYNQDGVVQWGETLHSLSTDGNGDDFLPFSCPVGITFENAYLQFFVYQTSGGDLDLKHVTMSIIEVAYSGQ